MSLPFSVFLLLITFVFVETESLRLVILLLCCFVFALILLTITLSSGSLLSFLFSSLAFVSLCYFYSTSILIFYITFEFSLVPVSFLILLFGYQPENLQASLYLLVYTLVGSLPLLFFVSVYTFDLESSFSNLSYCTSFLFLLSFMIKSPLFFLHSWLPKAHTEAPLIGSMLLSGILLKFGGYGVLLLSPFLHSSSFLYLYFSLIGSVVCCLICLRSWDLKSLVAYSSIVHIGFVTLGALTGTVLGCMSALGIIISHSLISPLIFSLANDFYSSNGSRSLIFGFSSALSRPTLLLFCFWSGMNFGLPPSLPFWVEVSLYSIFSSFFVIALIPIFLTSYFCFLYSVFFYVLSTGGRSSSSFFSFPLFYSHLSSAYVILGLPIISSSLLLF